MFLSLDPLILSDLPDFPPPGACNASRIDPIQCSPSYKQFLEKFEHWNCFRLSTQTSNCLASNWRKTRNSHCPLAVAHLFPYISNNSDLFWHCSAITDTIIQIVESGRLYLFDYIPSNLHVNPTGNGLDIVETNHSTVFQPCTGWPCMYRISMAS